ncbi:MAG: 50S ribosomal protein L32 [Bacteroidales bacterium]|jgi:large subunit ribosomal protein L32|nr:50S ribosomal protein L32 [Bacteroidales bacterium]
MAHPKSRISKQRKHKRRTHYKAELPTLATCSNCGATVEYHRVCPECGYYRGKLAVEKFAKV